MLRQQAVKRLGKRAKRGFRGYPVGTVACYGPDASKATKLVASIIFAKDESPAEQRRWFSDNRDVRSDPAIAEAVIAFFEEFAVTSVAMADRIIGCPHEEGVDYEGQICPACPYWAERDRWTGKPIKR